MSIFAIDIGTIAGWAWCNGKTVSPMLSGVLRLTRENRESELFNELDMIDARLSIKSIYYEEVVGHRGTYAAQVYGGLRSIVKLWCGETVGFHGIHVGTIKKFWTGNGRASKEMMMDEARNRGFKPQDDNEADAIALLHYAMGCGRE